jgi:adenine C2-methylase RlmN of 23S rRNA A2503 and tRNA A37
MGLYTVLSWATLLLILSTSSALTLQAGQRIASRRIIDTESELAVAEGLDQPASDGSNSIFDLRRVEQWATARGLKEHHLKTIYYVAMHSSSKYNANRENGAADETPPTFEEQLLQADFPRKHAAALVEEFSLTTCRVVETRSSTSGGLKVVIELPKSALLLETVIIRHEREGSPTRFTVCVSSQVGCAKACSFCATGSMGLLANLSSAEILEQVYLARSLLGEKHQDDLRNVVFMGMGEPLDNYDAVHEACRGLTHQCMFGFRAKHVTISTVGDAPDRIRQLADEAPQISLALSLHGATQELRLKLIPTAKRSPLEQLEEAMDYHALKSNRGAMLEYLLIDGVNDDDDAAKALVRFCRNRSSAGSKISPFVNLIPYNPTVAGEGFEYQTPSDDRIDTFHNLLREEGINSLVRWSSAKGRDADGACGQLALSVVKKAKESIAS